MLCFLVIEMGLVTLIASATELHVLQHGTLKKIKKKKAYPNS